MKKAMKRNMPEVNTKYAVLSRRTDLRTHVGEVLKSAGGPTEKEELSCEAGTLLKVVQSQLHAEQSSKHSIVQVLDFVHNQAIYENLYRCPQAHLIKVNEELWPYVISIADPKRRMRFAQGKEQKAFAFYLKVGDIVSVPGDLFRKSEARYDCIVRSIGPVVELHPVGYFFGLELLHFAYGHSPQADQIPFAPKYTKCEASLAIITTADWIFPLSSDVKKNNSAIDLITETIDKVRTAFAPSNCVGDSSTASTGSLRREKKQKQKEATAQFYDTPEPSPSIGQPTSDFGSGDPPTSASEMDSKMPYHSNSAETLEKEEFGQAIENYERNLDRQHVSTGTQAGHKPAGILKHNRLPPAVKDGTALKPHPVKSFEDRELIVIEEADIRESMKNQGDVIVVEPSEQHDLCEILGNNWPSVAGEAASILNNKQLKHTQNFSPGSGGSSNSSVSSATQVRQERNKSPNPLSHIATSHQAEPSNYETHKKATAHSTAINNNLDSVGRRSTAARATPEVLPGSPLQEVPDSGLGVGSMVEVSMLDAAEHLSGVIRWIGVPPNAQDIMVGVELEMEPKDKKVLTTDGTFDGVPLFKCHAGRALFVTPDRCQIDRRFTDAEGAAGGKALVDFHADSNTFGQVECPSVAGAVAPLKMRDLNALEEICGKFKGIQGHHNSCYLDATLFSMFTFTLVFDSLLFRPPNIEDIPHYEEVQRVLREEIVNPLRKNMFVRADRVMKLRELLDQLSSVSGLTTEEKDPEEFLNSLLAQIMRVEPFLKLSSGQDAYYYQLFVEKDEHLSFPSVQQLFEQSFYASDIKLKEVPSCLIIQMPRFGKNFKMYPRILPSQVLDVTDIIEDSPRQCCMCGKSAEYECRDCFRNNIPGTVGLENTTFCENCLETTHRHAKRVNHSHKKLSVPQDFRIMAEHMTLDRLYMELFAVVCIETSHYVAFAKTGSGPDAPWCFFDSMADRKGEKNGYNIPEMITVPDLPHWLSEEGARSVNETSPNDKMLPEHAKRLFCDAYMCMYQSTDVMMYR